MIINNFALLLSYTVKNSKLGKPQIVTVNVQNLGQFGITVFICNASLGTNSVNPDQTALDLGLHSLLRAICNYCFFYIAGEIRYKFTRRPHAS